MLTSRYNNARTGADLNETKLTPQNVNAKQFGKLFTLTVGGDVYAQPLYLPHLDIPGNGTHNVLFVVTEHDNVYAFDRRGRALNGHEMDKTVFAEELHAVKTNFFGRHFVDGRVSRTEFLDDLANAPPPITSVEDLG